MKEEITIPVEISVEVDDRHVTVKGPKGELKKEFKHFFDIKVEKRDGKIIIQMESDRRKAKAMFGTIASHINNLIKGVTEGFRCKMKIIYSHFPITVKVENDKLLIHNFLGEKVPRVAKIIGKTRVDVQGQDLIISGIDKENVGQTAANIEQACKIRKYDRRVFQDGIYILKEG